MFVFVLFLCSSYNILDSDLSEYSPTNIYNSGIGKYCVTQKSAVIFLTLAPVNKSAKIEFFKKRKPLFLLFIFPGLVTGLNQ